MRDDNNIDKCKTTFVTWRWLVGIIIGMVVPSFTYAFMAGTSDSKKEQRIIYLEKQYEKIDKKLDKILEKINK